MPFHERDKKTECTHYNISSKRDFQDKGINKDGITRIDKKKGLRSVGAGLKPALTIILKEE